MLAAPLFSLHPFCGEWEVEDKEKGVWLVLSPESMYSVKLTNEDRERNFIIKSTEDFENDKGESVGLLLKITKI
jgi:hypothetical protein